MNRALRRISIAVLVMFVLLIVNVNYLQGFDTASLASKPGNSRAFYAAQNQYQRGSIVTSDGKVIAASRLSSGNDSIKYQRYYPSGPEYAPVTGYYTIFGATGIEAAKNSLLSGNDSSLDVRKIIDLITGKTTKGATVQVTVNSKAQDAAWNALKALGQAGRGGGAQPEDRRDPGHGLLPQLRPQRAGHPRRRQAQQDRQQAAQGPGAAAAEPGPAGDVPARFDVQDRDELGAADPEPQYHDQHQRRLRRPPSPCRRPSTSCTTTRARRAATGSGQAPLITAFAQSCDTTFAKIGIQVGANALNDMAEQFGMNDADLTIPLPVAKSNYVIPASQALTAFSAIGQFSDTGHPLQEGHVLRGRRQRRQR